MLRLHDVVWCNCGCCVVERGASRSKCLPVRPTSNVVGGWISTTIVDVTDSVLGVNNCRFVSTLDEVGDRMKAVSFFQVPVRIRGCNVCVLTSAVALLRSCCIYDFKCSVQVIVVV